MFLENEHPAAHLLSWHLLSVAASCNRKVVHCVHMSSTKLLVKHGRSIFSVHVAEEIQTMLLSTKSIITNSVILLFMLLMSLRLASR